MSGQTKNDVCAFHCGCCLSGSGCSGGCCLDRPLFWHPCLLFSSFLFFSPAFLLWRPSGHHRGSFCVSHMRAGVRAYHTRMNLASQCEDLCVRPHPPSFLFSLHLLVPYTWELAPFTLLSSPLERGLHGPQTAQFYALFLQLHSWSKWKFVKTQREIKWLCPRSLTYRPGDHVVKSVGQLFNKRKGQNVQNISSRPPSWIPPQKRNAKVWSVGIKECPVLWDQFSSWLNHTVSWLFFSNLSWVFFVTQAHLLLMFNLPQALSLGPHHVLILKK